MTAREGELAGASGAGPGHTWRSRWDSLTLFTPAQYAALPGMPFPGSPKEKGEGPSLTAERLPGHAQQTPVAASPVVLPAWGPPQHWVPCPAGALSSSASTASQRCSPSWPQKVALSARTV